MEGGENPGFLLTVTHYSNFVARRQTLKAFALGLNLGQPIDKSERRRSNSSSQKDPGLHNEDRTLQKLNKRYREDSVRWGRGVVGEMGTDILWCTPVSGTEEGRRDQRNLLLTQLCSAQVNCSAEQQLKRRD